MKLRSGIGIGRCVVACLVTLAGGAFAEQAAAPAVDPLQLDQKIQQLKEQAVEINHQAQAVEDSMLYPDRTRVAVYVGVEVAGLLLQNVNVSIDGGKPTVYEYDRTEAIVLQQGKGISRIMRLNAPPGTHHLHAMFTGRDAEASPLDPSLIASVDADFVKDQRDPANIELYVTRGVYLGRPALKLRSWSPTP
jgi:hypothetical protein